MSDTTGQQEPPRKLAADDDRRRVTDELSAAVGRGQLQFDEFEQRTAQAWASRYRDELIPLIADIHDSPDAVVGVAATPPQPMDTSRPVSFAGHEVNPASAAGPPANARAAVEQVRSRITGQKDGSELSFSMMGGASRKGDWLVASTHTSITVMGGNGVDLREARFESGEIRIYAFAVMGGIDIIVPEGVRVVSDGIGIMGGFDTSVHKHATVRPSELPADAPVVRVSGLAIMGGVTVVTKPRK